MKRRRKSDDEENYSIMDTLNDFISETHDEPSQEEEINAYKEKSKKNNNNNNSDSDEDTTENEEHLKRIKLELIASLRRVEILEKKLFEEKEIAIKKNIKLYKEEKNEIQNTKQNLKQSERIKESSERSRD